MTPEEERKLSEAIEKIRQRQEAEQRGNTTQDFKDMGERNKDKQPYQLVEPIGVNPVSVSRVLAGAGHTATNAADAMRQGAERVRQEKLKGHGGGLSAPAFNRPRPTRANIFRYHGVGNGGRGSGGAPNFGIGNNPVNFSSGGSAVNTAHLHGFGAMQPGGMFGSLSGLSGKTFGMNDGKLEFTKPKLGTKKKK